MVRMGFGSATWIRCGSDTHWSECGEDEEICGRLDEVNEAVSEGTRELDGFRKPTL